MLIVLSTLFGEDVAWWLHCAVSYGVTNVSEGDSKKAGFEILLGGVVEVSLTSLEVPDLSKARVLT